MHLQTISSLEKDIAGLKKEIGDRDETIGDKEKRIYDLKKKNQVMKGPDSCREHPCECCGWVKMWVSLGLISSDGSSRCVSRGRLQLSGSRDLPCDGSCSGMDIEAAGVQSASLALAGMPHQCI